MFVFHVNEHRTQGSGAQCTCSAQQAHSVCTRAAEAEGRRLEVRLLMVYIFSGMTFMQLLHRHVLVEAGLEARLHVVERGYLQTPTHEIVSLMNDSCLAARSFYDMKVACRFVLQLRLFHWLERQNCEHGVGVFSPLFLFFFLSLCISLARLQPP